ncbi:hypothetical protein NA56DRAFT_647641 [Hyaloscypha hepaticicola]|uniref:GPI anchored protein n=1 Tax=Hyaloscypha hepaticicola TaxID=2082293 RepID=A0A2J6PXK7_9HELO|nr:hypothetical protein NA56DRAFT_647641 [Hyaloscypha hepaticicola]
MPFSALSVFGLAFAGLSFAQNTMVSLFVPGADTQPLIGAVVGSDASATTYAIRCIDDNTCGFPGGLTLTEGPSTAVYTISEAAEFTGIFDCSLAGTSSAVCVQPNGGSGANDPGTSTVTLTGTDYTSMPVTIVSADALTTGNSGSELDPTPTGSGTATASGTGIKSGPTTVGSVTPTMTSSMASGSGNVAPQSGSTTSSSHAGGPAITGNAMLVMGGAAVAMAVLG